MNRGAFDALMYDVCVRYGYCGSVRDGKLTHVARIIPEHGQVTADQFVAWVFLANYGYAEPEKPNGMWGRHRQTIKGWFVEHMGGDVVEASKLKFGV
jgi:hypothetical protein